MTSPASSEPSDNEIEQLLEDELLDRRMKVMFLRNSGATWTKIAQALQISTTTARKDWDRAAQEHANQSPDQRRAVQSSVILDMRRANYAKMLKGDVDASNIILKGMVQEAKLYGLYPKVITVAGISDTEFANEFVRLFESVRDLDPKALKELTSASEATSYIEGEIEPDPVAGGPDHGSGAGHGSPPAGPAGQAHAGDPERSAVERGDGTAPGHRDGPVEQPGGPGPDAGGMGQPEPDSRPAPDDDDWSNL